MNVRRIETSEAELFHSFRLRGLRECPAAFGSTYEQEAAMPAEAVRGRFPCADENFVLGAFDDGGRLVGVAGFYRMEAVKARHKGVVWGMYVAPEARGRGVGGALLAELIERCRGLAGLEQLTLDVVVPNDAARSLYLRSGFRVLALEEEAMKHEGVYYSVEHMALRLP